VGAWYWLGVALGLGVALSVVLAGALARVRRGGLLVAIAAVAMSALVGWLVVGSALGLVGVLGALTGALASLELARGTARRGGTGGGTLLLLGGGALVIGALAFVPAVGYLLVVLSLAIGVRLRRRAGSRYAGLRSLARD
jgi:hypothetical protein